MATFAQNTLVSVGSWVKVLNATGTGSTITLHATGTTAVDGTVSVAIVSTGTTDYTNNVVENGATVAKNESFKLMGVLLTNTEEIWVKTTGPQMCVRVEGLTTNAA